MQLRDAGQRILDIIDSGPPRKRREMLRAFQDFAEAMQSVESEISRINRLFRLWESGLTQEINEILLYKDAYFPIWADAVGAMSNYERHKGLRISDSRAPVALIRRAIAMQL